MLTVIIGTDSLRQKKKEEVKKVAEKEGRTVLDIPYASFIRSEAETYLHPVSLFGEKYCVIFSGILSHEAGTDFLADRADDMAKSDTIFIVDEKEMAKAFREDLESLGATIHFFDEKKTKEEKFNVFALTDAFNLRDKKNLWVLYHRALRAGSAPEELTGILMWNLKNFALYFAGPAESGLAPFVLSKIKSAASRFTKKEVHHLSFELTDVVQHSRRGKGDLSTLLERYLLKI